MRPHKWDPTCPPPRDLVRPRQIDPTGTDGPTRGQAQRGRWRRTSYGFHVPSTVDPTVPEQRIMEQSVRLPAGGAVTGWASCRLHRATFFDGILPDGVTLIPVPLCVGSGQIRPDPAIRLSREPLPPDEVVVICSIACTVRIRGLFDAARYAPDLREAVVAIDMMAAAERVSPRQLTGYVDSRPGWRGVDQVRQALRLADERSRSPNETRMRLVWRLDAGLPAPEVNQPVWDLDGNLLGIADLFDPVAGVVGEYDGAEHRRAKRQSKDVAREERFRRRDLEYFKVTGPDMLSRPLVVDRMLGTRSRAKWLPESRRPWTLEPPPDWEPEWTLDDKLEYWAWQAALDEQYAHEGDPDINELINMGRRSP